MPKIHDLCQIFADEATLFLKAIPPGKQTLALAWIYHGVEADLLARHHDALVIAQHLWLVLEERLQAGNIHLPEAIGGFDESFREDDPRLGYCTEDAIRLAHRLFPQKMQ